MNIGAGYVLVIVHSCQCPHIGSIRKGNIVFDSQSLHFKSHDARLRTCCYIPVQHPHCLNSKCTCRNLTSQWRAGLQMKCGQEIVGSMLSWDSRKRFSSADHQKPGLNIVQQYFNINSGVHYQDSEMLYVTRTDGWSACPLVFCC